MARNWRGEFIIFTDLLKYSLYGVKPLSKNTENPVNLKKKSLYSVVKVENLMEISASRAIQALFGLACPARSALWGACRTHDLVVVSSRPI